MRVFLSWSGKRSRAVATALRDWIPDVLQFVDPWMSDLDIYAGQRWASVIGQVLEETSFGILCITEENRTAPWLLFEAGALSKTVAEASVIPLLLDVSFSDINNGPLGQFQAKKLDKQGIHQLIVAINAQLGDPITSTRLSRLFERSWPDLEEKLNNLPLEGRPEVKEHRPTREMLEELAISIQRIDGRLGAMEAELFKGEALWTVAADMPREAVSADVVREAVRQAVENASVRSVARDIGMSPTGLQQFIIGATPYLRTFRKIQNWYMEHLIEETKKGAVARELAAELHEGQHASEADGAPDSRSKSL